MLARDIDLLVIEPNLFADVGWAGQRLVSAPGTLTGTALSVPGADFAQAQVEAGCVAVQGGLPLEVMERTSATELRVSLVRWTRTGPVIPPLGPATGLCEVWTLRPQIALAHRQALRAVGIDPDAQDGEPDVTRLTNPFEVAMLESLIALHIIYAGAAALSPAGSGLERRAEQYRRRAADLRSRLTAHIDRDGDGAPDAHRRPCVGWLRRA